jgi:molybdopterin-containing oxidoreductase family iron-sulfur binding subunit
MQLGMVIDMRKFYGNEEMLDACIAACNKVHNVPLIPETKSEIKWIWKTGYGNAFPEHSHAHRSTTLHENQFLVLCNHCENPSCVKACPTKATFKSEQTGIVAMDYHRCIGCRFCMAACPYGARSFNWQDPRPFVKAYNPEFPTRMRGVVEKCNFCVERIALGKEPACVEACGKTGAIVFGDINDPGSEIRKVLGKEFTIQRKPSAGTKPSVFYIV